jgi:Tfp pilus assembly protein FimT
VISLVGILASVAAPSFASLLDSMKVDQTINEIRMALQDTQRQAIRTNQVCVVQVPTTGNSPSASPLPQWLQDLIAKYFPAGGSGSKKISGNCLTSGSPELSNAVDLASNLQTAQSAASSSSGSVVVQYSPLGSADFAISSAVTPPATPVDPTGKVVAFIASKPQVKKKCVAISSNLGLTRIGVYTGSTDPKEITDTGLCSALDWKQQ